MVTILNHIAIFVLAEEYDRGYHRYYHKNSKLKEYKARNNIVIPKTYKEWDKNGNLIWNLKVKYKPLSKLSGLLYHISTLS